MAELLPHHRNLPVPFLSQRKNTYVWKKDGVEVSMACRSCNITCIAMLLHYFGITSNTSNTPDTPDTMMKNYFISTTEDYTGDYSPPKAVGAFESWENMEKFVNNKYNLKTKLYKHSECRIQNFRDSIAAGYPVMMSLGLENAKERINENLTKDPGSGHIVVVRGFTKIGSVEYIILNDPWGSADGGGHKVNEGEGSYYTYAQGGSNGDNVVLKVSEFQKMIHDDESIHRAMVIYASLWQGFNGKEMNGTDALFPMNADFMWHSGIHLSIQKEIRSIGAGRLLAVRNSDAINGSASFMLVQHQVAKIEEENEVKVGKILPFYALYMHTDSINIQECAETYFTKGKLPDAYNFKWLLQLFSNMLPHVRVISRTATVQPIYEADRIVGSGLRHTDDAGNMISASKEFHGRRMLVHLLPVDELFDQLLNPANYANPSFCLEMLDPNKFVKEVTIGNKTTKYVFFHSYDASTDASTDDGESRIFCSKFVDVDGDGFDDTGFFEKPTTVNGGMLKRNAKILSLLHNSEEVVSLNDLVNFPVTSGESAKVYLDDRANNFTFEGAEDVGSFKDLLGTAFLNKQKAYWKERFESRITDGPSGLLLTDNVFNAMADICSELVGLPVDINNNKDKISAKLKKYFTKYTNARYAELRLVLKNWVIIPDEETDSEDNSEQVTHTWKYHLRSTLNACLSAIQGDGSNLLFANVELTTGSGADIANTFVDKLKELGLPCGYPEIAIEMACCRLFNISKSKIIDGENEYFKLSDKSINALLESYSGFNSFQIYQHYVDAIIEISKNDIIGKCGRYNDEMDMIHFEIFSLKDCNIYTELGIKNDGLITDEETGKFFDASHTVEMLRDPIEKHMTENFIFLNGNIILSSEFDRFKGNNIFSEYAVKHISEWSPTLTYEKYKENHPVRFPVRVHIRKDEKIKPFHVQDIDGPADDSAEFDDKWFWVKDYFEQCAVPYHWSLKTIIGKKTSDDDLYIYYNPIYFLDQLIIKDKESRDLHEAESEPSTS